MIYHGLFKLQFPVLSEQAKSDINFTYIKISYNINLIYHLRYNGKIVYKQGTMSPSKQAQDVTDKKRAPLP